MQNEIENKEEFIEEIKKEKKDSTFLLILPIIVMVVLASIFVSFLYILKEMFSNNKTFIDSLINLKSIIKSSWLERLLIYGSMLIAMIIVHFIHERILNKKGVAYNILSVIAFASVLYLGFSIVIQSIERLKILYSENFAMWCFSITCIGICIYYFMIEKDIFKQR